MDSTDNFVEYGTPLEPLEEEEVPSKKPVNLQNQIVVDEQGRRRFHGAFTGGFSAGYYNTVGSKEGWTPSDYKSSRQSRTETPNSRKTQNVQDFMDEEDMGAFGIAPQILRATNDFEQREGRKRARPGPESVELIPGVPVLEQIIQPVKETIGIRILQRMGWKPGQGVGPRLSKAERKFEREKRKDKEKKRSQKLPKDEDEPMIEGIVSDSKVYGCYMPPELRKQDETSDSDESIIDIQNVTFAPDDFENPLCNPKENTFGLGYIGLDRPALPIGHVDLSVGIKSRVENRKLNIRGEAFGIGAFEDADEEVYHRSDMSEYDFSLETPDERKSRRGQDRSSKNQKVNEKKEVGTIVGFIKAKNPPSQRKYFPPPHLPKDFEPKHYIRQSRFEQPPPSVVDETQKKKLGLDRHALTIEERQILLGEEKIPLTPKEVEELEAKAKEEAEQAKKDLAREKAERLRKFTEVLQTFSSNKTASSAQVDTSARPAFKPFMKNPEKQDRYDKYMTLSAAGFEECLKDLQPLEMTEWDRERERMEFERASALYKPMGGVMSSRFVSAKSHDISHLVPTREIFQEKDPTQDPKVAAKMSLFGKLTHKTYEWHPDRLLCKRFNVPHPYPDSKMVGVRRDPTPSSAVASVMPTTESNSSASEETPQAPPPPPPQLPLVKKSLFDNIDFSKPPPGLLPLETTDSEGICPPGTEDEQMLVDTSDVIPTSPAEPEPSKPSIDLFKEIFENSSSESDVEEPPKPPEVIQRGARSEYSGDRHNSSNKGDSRHHNETHNSREEAQKPKGIFDNLDFSKLEGPKSTPEEKNNERREERRQRNPVTKKSEDEDDDVNAYGPLPPRRPISGNSAVPKDVSTKQQTPNFLSKGHRENPISFPLTQRTSTRETEVDGVVWVEKRDLDSSTGKSDTISISSSKEPNRSHRHKKKKKLKERSRTSKPKHKKSKKGKEVKHKKSGKSKKHEKKYSSDSRSRSENSSDDDSSSSSSDEDSTIQIHQSFNNKALLAKLKELTK